MVYYSPTKRDANNPWVLEKDMYWVSADCITGVIDEPESEVKGKSKKTFYTFKSFE